MSVFKISEYNFSFYTFQNKYCGSGTLKKKLCNICKEYLMNNVRINMMIYSDLTNLNILLEIN